MAREIRVKVNRTDYASRVEDRLLLVHYLREQLGLTGTHVGCDTGHCGACTIVWNGHAVKSCMLFAVQVDGQELLTVEGLAQDGKLHPIQQAFWDGHALECGYCTPGMLMSTYALLKRIPNPSEEEIKRSIAGNLCRCTGYTTILDAVKAAAAKINASGTRPP